MEIKRKDKILAVIPALNEEGKIGIVISRIKSEASFWVDDILVVDDGSKDNTGLEAKNSGVTVISHECNKGVGSAMRTAIDYAREKKFDVILFLAGDNQDSPNEIKRLVCPILLDDFDFVQGSRYMAGGAKVNIPMFRWLTTKLYAFLFRNLVGFPVSDGTNGFRAFRLRIFNNKKINIWQRWLDHYELEPYLFYNVIKYKFKVTEAPVTKSYPRDDSGYAGYTKMIPILGWWSILRPLILLKIGIKK